MTIHYSDQARSVVESEENIQVHKYNQVSDHKTILFSIPFNLVVPYPEPFPSRYSGLTTSCP